MNSCLALIICSSALLATIRPSHAQDEERDGRDLIVRTSEGGVEGLLLGDNHRAWLGIPFAKPPLGDLRFAPPQKPDRRNGIMETKVQPNACPQEPDDFFGDFPGSAMWNPNTEISEDCLYLNVHSPRKVSKPLPVLVWIYGGAFTTGSITLDVYEPEALVATGRIVYVAMQYRLGAHGFLYLGQGSGAPGNVGLLDQVMALQWIQANIKSFGGNPNDVTIMGESAGGNAVALHMISSMSTNLFHKAIIQSAGLYMLPIFVTPETALQRSEALAERVGCRTYSNATEGILECLRSTPWCKLTTAAYDYQFVVTVDGPFLPEMPIGVDAQSKAVKNPVPTLIGDNANEGSVWLAYSFTDIFANEELLPEETIISYSNYTTMTNLLLDGVFPEVVRRAIAYAYRNTPDRDGYHRLFRGLEQMIADFIFVCPTEEFTQALAKAGSKVYRYFYEHRASIDPWPAWTGTKHGDEIEFTFGHPLANPGLYEKREVDFARDVVDAWITFVETGSPNRRAPVYNVPDYTVLKLNPDGFSTKNGKRKEACILWNELLPVIVAEMEDNACLKF